MRIVELLSGVTLGEDSPVGPNSPWNPHQMGPKGSVPPFAPRGGGMEMGANNAPGGDMDQMASNDSGGMWGKWGPPAGQMPGNMQRPPAPVAPTPTPGNMSGMGNSADASSMPAAPTGPSGGTMSSTPSEPIQTA